MRTTAIGLISGPFKAPIAARMLAVVAMGLAPFWSAQALAQDAAAGENKAATCVACHGPAGISSNPEWPNLAGQNAAYIERQLHLFKDGKRVNALMSGMSMSLSDQDMADLGAYYAAQSPATGSADESMVEMAQALYLGGDKEREIPACIACHGVNGGGNPGGFPAVSGQHATYTRNILGQFKNGEPWDDLPISDIMVDTAKRLSDEEIEALASYFQGLGG